MTASWDASTVSSGRSLGRLRTSSSASVMRFGAGTPWFQSRSLRPWTFDAVRSGCEVGGRESNASPKACRSCCDVQQRGDTDLIGYRVLGRQGELGHVADLEGIGEESGRLMLVVRGGVTDSLVFHLPALRLIGISHETATVATDVDVADFIPSFARDGTVELHLGSNCRTVLSQLDGEHDHDHIEGERSDGPGPDPW